MQNDYQKPVVLGFVSIVIVFIIPIACLTYFMVSFKNTSIHFAEKEMLGNVYQRSLMKILESSTLDQLARVAHQRVGISSQEFLAQTEGFKKNIEAEFQSIFGNYHLYERPLNLTAEELLERSQTSLNVETLKKRWDSLVANQKVVNIEAQERLYSDFNAQLLSLISYLGDQSNLILDPDLDSYYLMDLTLLVLPPFIQKIPEIVSYYQFLPVAHLDSEAEKIQRSVFVSTLKDVYKRRIQNSAQRSIDEDANFYGASQSVQKNLYRTTESFMNAIDQFAGQIHSAQKEKIYLKGVFLIQEAVEYWRIVSKELDVLLQERVAHESKAGQTAIWISILCISLACFVVFLIARLVVKTEMGLLDALKHQQAQIFHASKMSSLGEMASGIAHEMNNPLAILGAYARQLKTETKGNASLNMGTILQVAEKMEATVFRMSKIIRGLRTFSRDAENDPFELVSLKAILEEIRDLCAERVERENTQLVIEPFQDCTLYCRPAQLYQVFINLINNSFDAVAALPEKWIKIKIDDLGERIQIAVIDSGMGIPTDIADKIMTPFFSTKPAGTGTGLGLSISRKIVEQHSGRIFLNSFSKNTEFVVELPKKSKAQSVA